MFGGTFTRAPNGQYCWRGFIAGQRRLFVGDSKDAIRAMVARGVDEIRLA